MKWLLIALALACEASDCCGQDPRNRRFLREQAVAWAGPSSRVLVETEDEAAIALLRCSQYRAIQFAAFHASGGLGKLPRANDLLGAIAHPHGGDDVCVYIIQHANELADPEACDLFLEEPLDFALGFSNLSTAVAQRRASPWAGYLTSKMAWRAGLAILIGLFIYRRWQYRVRDSPA